MSPPSTPESPPKTGTPAPGKDGQPARRTTLPPPEWLGREGPRSAASLALERRAAVDPVRRRIGPRAEQAFLRGRLRQSHDDGDAEAERAAALGLARSLAQRGTELATAAKLARRALLLGEDVQMREELSGWFAGLGEPALAAATLRPLVEQQAGPAAANTLKRMAALLGRAGDASGAADALSDAEQRDPADPVAAELLGALGAWAPEAVSAERAAEAYVEGARRRDELGERAAAFEDLLRAFEMSPASPLAAERLSAALGSRGRAGAADEVLRWHAQASGTGAAAVHVRRMRSAAAEGDLARALSAGFDARLDAEPDPAGLLAALDDRASAASERAQRGPEGRRAGQDRRALAEPSFDALLARVGLFELVAARAELVADALAGAERARLLLALGRGYATTLASPERAVEAWVDALGAEPGNEETKEALREHATTTRDQTPLSEALIRAGQSRASSAADRAACLRELMALAEHRLGDPALALWALERLHDLGEPQDELDSVAARLAPRVRLQDEALAGARASLDASDGPERLEPLRRMAAVLRGRPDALDEYLAVLVELAGLAPDDRVVRLSLERVLARAGRWQDLEAWITQSARGAASTRFDQDRARLGRATLRRRAGDLDGALGELRPLLADNSAHVAAWSMALALAARRGDGVTRAVALLRLASPLGPSQRAMLCAVAADALLESGDLERAQAAAEQASHADPSLARPVAALAEIALRSGGHGATQVIERAMGVVVPRAALCRTLADAHDALGEPMLGVAWTGRWLALRPGDPEAASALLDRVTRSGDAARLSDALAWILSRSQPLGPLDEPLRGALVALSRLSPPRVAALARRALDVMGPRSEALRETVLACAARAGEHGLAITVLERWLAAGAPDALRGKLLLDLARRRRDAGDADGAARALVRALDAGANVAAVIGALDVALPARSSDGEVALLGARARALAAVRGADPNGQSLAWREYGAALWDLAGDPSGAVEAWERGVACEPERGLARFAQDLMLFGGHDEALRRLQDYAERLVDPGQAARVLAEAAALALGAGELAAAFSVSVRALELDRSRADVLAIAERSASAGDMEALERAYQSIADAALGCYGERAVHYRAARQFERRGELVRGLGHALQALESVPAEGVAFVQSARLAERTGETGELVRCLERVASRAKSNEQRSSWLRRAALFAGTSLDGRRQRVDVLLRALVIRPDAESMELLGKALRELLAEAPDDRDIVELRFERAITILLARLDGPDGARIGIEAALAALEAFGSPGLALAALGRAMSADADVDEYSRLMPHVTGLSRDTERATELVAAIAARNAEPHSNVGRALLELGAELAAALGDAASSARLWVAAALGDPDDARLRHRAEAALRTSEDSELRRRLLDAVPASERHASLMEMANTAEAGGRLDVAIEALQRLRAEAPASAKLDAGQRLRELLARTGRRNELEALLSSDLADGTLDAPARVRAARDLAALVSARGDPERALQILTRELETRPDDLGLLGDCVTLARQAGDKRRQAEVLGRLADRTSDDASKLGLLRDLAPLLEEVGDDRAALGRWSELLVLDADDPGALAALERDAEARADYETLAAMLARRAALASRVDDVRRIRLRRATVLEQRLGRPDEARTELEHVLAATGDNLSMLRVLADLDERLGALLRAAPLWLRASAVARDRGEAADLGRRACEAYLNGGDVDSARRVLDGLEAWASSERLIELRVEIERRSANPLALGDALEELAMSALEPARRRAELLVEAARAAEVGGDRRAALSRAQGAARIAPESADAQLCARRLEYLTRGAGSPEEAHVAASELRGIQDARSPEQRDLAAFLIAEALDASVGGDVSTRELMRAQRELGTLPLVALGLAERFAQAGRHTRALDFYEVALGGDLQGLRRPGAVSLRAAASARAAGVPERALDCLEPAVIDSETRAQALALQAQLRRRLREHPPAEASLPGPRSSSPPPRVLSPSPSALAARSVSPAPKPQRPSATPPRSTLRSPTPRSSPSGHSSRPPSPEVVEGSASATAFRAASAGEKRWIEALANGSVEAGKELIRQLENRSDRTHDLLSACRRVAQLAPGDRWVLEKLYEAALADRNFVFARAVEHVRGVFDRSAPAVEPPPLGEQPEHPERVHALLFRDTLGATEALALVWEGAEHIFRRDPSTYGVTGLERVPLGAPTPLGHVYSGAARVLGLTRTPLFQRRSAGAVTISVALLSPPALILSGDVAKETPELSFHIGAMLAATLPQHALLFGSSEPQTRAVLKGLSLAFGPPRPDHSGLTSVANLAEVLWESIPARAQRRLRELGDDPKALDYDAALSGGRSGIRRAGLFVAGHLEVALRETCAEEGIEVGAVDDPARLAALCSTHRAVADLVRLATSAEYAEARWQPARDRTRHPSGTWATF